MRDERTQAAGPFPRVKGSRIVHERLLAFIGRNYAPDDTGAWYFQNGPQRVYVQLEAAPWTWRIDAAPGWPVHSHTGRAAQVHSSWLDEQGRLFLATDIGFGLVHSMDMALAAQAVEEGHWHPAGIGFSEMPGRFGYVLMKAQEPAAPP
jgi:hypothetical protein